MSPVHDCENMPDTVEIRHENWPEQQFHLVSDCCVYSDSDKKNFFLVNNYIIGIKFCPFCGERLKSE